MAKFVFRFASYLNLKSKLEEQKKLAYGNALKQVEIEKQKKFALLAERASNIEEFRKKVREHIAPAELQRHNNYLTYLKEAVAKQEIVIQKAEEQAELRRLELVEAMKDRKTLEKLKENVYEQYLIEEKQAEMKVTDEIVSYKYNNLRR